MDNLFTTFAAGACNDTTFLGLEPWYHYIPMTSKCDFGVDPATGVTYSFHLLGANSDLLLILLAVVDDLLRIAGLVAVGFVIFAGIKYLTSQGAPDATAQAQSTLINALIGLAIAIVSIGAVSFLGNQLDGNNVSISNVGPGGLNVSLLPNPIGVDNGNIIQTILTIVFGVVGAMSLLFVVIGGFRYVLSQGNPQGAETAKNTIIYALIGMVVAIVAESIVSLVVSRL